MPAPALVLKAYKVKRALKRLQRAKENAMRIHKGKRPKYPCYEECWNCIVQCLKNTFCKAFCPCCIYRKDRGKGKDEFSGNCVTRMCIANTFENNALKSLFGFMSGAVLTIGAFFFLVHQLNCDPRAVTVFCILLGFALTIGLAFSKLTRCIVLLTLPELFSNRGRMALMAYAYILVMSGPTKNAMRNANILVESMNCGQELIVNQTKAILRSIFAPLLAIIQTMRDILQALRDFFHQVKEAFLAIRDLFYEIIAAIKSMFGWITSIAKICSNKYGSPYERCIKAFDDAIADCRYHLGIFDFLCYIVVVVKYVCEIARLIDLLCLIPKAIKSGVIDPLKKKVKQFVAYIVVQFYVNVTFTHKYHYSLEQSKTFQDIRADIAEEVSTRTKWFTSIIDWSDLIMSLFLLMVIIRALIYRIRYLTADHYDNIYITFLVRDIDDRRFHKEREIILPLSFREKRKYINPFSIKMGKTERRRLISALTVLFISGCQMGFYILLDYSLFHLLRMIRFHGRVQAKGQMPTSAQVEVKGEGVLADMYRQMITSLDPLMNTIPDFDTTHCLPNPTPIDEERYEQIGIMYGICVLVALTESYGLRLRHIICGCYYPKREKSRAVWLYNHILKTRGGLLKFLRRKIRRKYYGDDTLEKITLMDRLCNQYPLLGRLMKSFGVIRIYCICCNEMGKEGDKVNFKYCATSGCKAIYCHECFEDINNLCTLCMKPVDYGDLSDVSEEKDSSEEEERKKMSDREAQKEEEESSEEDRDYQYEERRRDDSDDEEPKEWKDVESQKKRELVKVEELDSDELSDSD